MMINPVGPPDDAHPATGKLRELFREHMRRDCTMRGWVKVICIDDGADYRPGPAGTMVPRANEKGGILGLPTSADRKYGEGVTRRTLDCSMNPIKVVEGFRPDIGEKLQEEEIREEEQDDHPLEHTRRKERLDRPTEEDRLGDIVYWLMESIGQELYEKDIDDDDPADIELRLPRKLWDICQQEKWEDYMGHPVVYGVAGEVSLRHKRTGITHKVKWKD